MMCTSCGTIRIEQLSIGVVVQGEQKNPAIVLVYMSVRRRVSYLDVLIKDNW